MLTFLGRRLARTNRFQTLITAVCQTYHTRLPIDFALLKQRKVMDTTPTKIHTDHLLGLGINDRLRFQSMALLFAAIITPLSFFGR